MMRRLVVTVYDLRSAAFFTDPYGTYARMRRDDPVYRDPATGIWFLTRYRDLVALAEDRRFSNTRVSQFFAGVSPELADEVEVVRRFFADWLGFVDPPQHTRLRRLTARAFSPRRVAALRGYVQTVVDAAVDRVADAGDADLIAELALPVPAQVIACLLGVPAPDVEQFKSWTEDVLRVPAWVGDPDENLRIAHRGVQNLEQYFRDLIAWRRRNPADDLLGVLVRADQDGQLLTEQELVSTCALLLVAGHETTTYLIGNGTLALLRHPAELARLRAQPELIESAVEELLRYDGPVAGIARLASQDSDIGGQLIPAGQVAMGMLGAANRDPEVFHDPDRLDIGRRDSHHLGFGDGRHFCPGAAMARLEARIALCCLMTRLPRLQLATDDLNWTNSLAIRGVTKLPVLTR
jgi:cytochrome P450